MEDRSSNSECVGSELAPSISYDGTEDKGVVFTFGRSDSSFDDSSTFDNDTSARRVSSSLDIVVQRPNDPYENVWFRAAAESNHHPPKINHACVEQQHTNACEVGSASRTLVITSPLDYSNDASSRLNTRQDEQDEMQTSSCDRQSSFFQSSSPASPEIGSANASQNNISNNLKSLLTDDSNIQVALRNEVQKTELDHNIVVNYYVLPKDTTLGSGVTSQVKMAFSLENRTKYAVKIIRKTKLLSNKLLRKRGNQFSDAAYREIAVLRKLDHPNIVKLLEVLDNPDEDNLYLVFELLPKGPVINIPTPIPLEMELAWKYFRDIVAGVDYLHQNHIIHRDLKPENMLVDERDRVKISDFGTSIEWHYNDQISNPFTTPAFTAPECLSEEAYLSSGTAMDVWSLGISLYAMLTGNVPWTAKYYDELINQVQNMPFHYPEHFPTDLIDILRRLLDRDPVKRIDSWDIKKHAWILKRGAASWPQQAQNDVNTSAATNVTDEDVAHSVKRISRSDSVILLQRAANRYMPSFSAIDFSIVKTTPSLDAYTTSNGNSNSNSMLPDIAECNEGGGAGGARRMSTSSTNSSSSGYRRTYSMPPERTVTLVDKLSNPHVTNGGSLGSEDLSDDSSAAAAAIFDVTREVLLQNKPVFESTPSTYRSVSMEARASGATSPSTPRPQPDFVKMFNNSQITWASKSPQPPSSAAMSPAVPQSVQQQQ